MVCICLEEPPYGDRSWETKMNLAMRGALNLRSCRMQASKPSETRWLPARSCRERRAGLKATLRTPRTRFLFWAHGVIAVRIGLRQTHSQNECGSKLNSGSCAGFSLCFHILASLFNHDQSHPLIGNNPVF